MENRKKSEHFSGVGLATSVDLTEATTADNSMYTKVVHGELYVELVVLPLTKAGELLALGELLEEPAAQRVGYLFLVRLEQIRRQRMLVRVRIVLGQIVLHGLEGFFRIGLFIFSKYITHIYKLKTTNIIVLHVSLTRAPSL